MGNGNVLGVDPSTVSTGYAVFNKEEELILYGKIEPDEDLSHENRLKVQFEEIQSIIEKYQIKSITCEDQFFGRNVDTLKKINRTCGVVMLAASITSTPIELIYPSAWRKLFHGKGNVKKRDTIKLVNEVYGLSLKSKDDDIADAIGIAWCGLQ